MNRTSAETYTSSIDFSVRVCGKTFNYNHMLMDSNDEDSIRLLQFNALTLDHHLNLQARLTGLLNEYAGIDKPIMTFSQYQTAMHEYTVRKRDFSYFKLINPNHNALGETLIRGSKKEWLCNGNSKSDFLAIGRMSRADGVIALAQRARNMLDNGPMGMSPNMQAFLKELELELHSRSEHWRQLPSLAQRVSAAAERLGPGLVGFGYDREDRIEVYCAATGTHFSFDRSAERGFDVFLNRRIWGMGNNLRSAVQDALLEQERVLDYQRGVISSAEVYDEEPVTPARRLS